MVNGRGEAKQDTMYRRTRWVQSGVLRHKTYDHTVVSLVGLQNVNEAELSKANPAKKGLNVGNKGLVEDLKQRST
jgi:hypothetical protein